MAVHWVIEEVKYFVIQEALENEERILQPGQKKSDCILRDVEERSGDDNSGNSPLTAWI